MLLEAGEGHGRQANGQVVVEVVGGVDDVGVVLGVQDVQVLEEAGEELFGLAAVGVDGVEVLEKREAV